RRNEIVECLIDPLTKTAEISKALDKITERASYLFLGADERIYFGQTANVTPEINETAVSLADEIVDQELRTKLEAVFRPAGKKLYGSMAILPSLDQIKVERDHPDRAGATGSAASLEIHHVVERPGSTEPDS